MGKGSRGRDRRSPITPETGTGDNSRGRRDLRVVEGGRQIAGRPDGNSGKAVKKRRAVPPGIRKRRRLAIFLFVLVTTGVITYLLLGPILRNIDSRRNLAELEDELEIERAKTRELQERMERAQSKEYVEDEARGMNYVKPGEIPIVVLDDEEAPEDEATFPALEPESSPSSSE